MRLHVLGLVHTELTRKWSACAYTQRTLDFCNMMTDRGAEVMSYGGEACEARVHEHVPIITLKQQQSWYPDSTPLTMFNDFNAESLPWRVFNLRAGEEIRKRWQAGDIICFTQGVTQRPVIEQLEGLTNAYMVEPGIGYTGIWAPYRVFESVAWRHHMAGRAYGADGVQENDNLRWYDDVIPRGYFPEHFPLGTGGGDLLFMGRLISRKGPQIAGEISKQLGIRLLVAGQGVAAHSRSKIITTDGTTIEGNLEYVGVVGPEERAKLMGQVRAVVMPTTYLEPGGGVAIEAQMCGTPVITVPYGAMTETVLDGLTGYHCTHLSQFLDAAEAAPKLSRPSIRNFAVSRFGADVISGRFYSYFRRLQTLEGKGWYQLPPSRGTLPAQS